MTEREYRAYIEMLDQMRTTLMADPAIASWREKGSGDQAFPAQENPDEAEIVSSARNFMNVLDSRLAEGKAWLNEKPGEDFGRPAFENCKESLDRMKELAAKVFKNQENDEYTKVTTDAGIQLAQSLAVAFRSAGQVYEKLEPLQNIAKAENAADKSREARASFLGKRNEVLNQIKNNADEKEVLEELDPDKKLDDSLEGYQTAVYDAEDQLNAAKKEKAKLEEKKYIIPKQISDVFSKMQEETAHKRDLEGELTSLEGEEEELKAGIVNEKLKLEKGRADIKKKNTELDTLIEGANEKLEKARTDRAILEADAAKNKTKEQIASEMQAKLKEKLVPGKSYTLSDYMKDRQVLLAARKQRKEAEDKMETFKNVSKEAKKLFKISTKTGDTGRHSWFGSDKKNADTKGTTGYMRDTWRKQGDMEVLYGLQSYIQRVNPKAPAFMTTDTLEKALAANLEIARLTEIKADTKINNVMGRSDGDSATLNQNELNARQTEKEYHVLELQEVSQVSSEKLEFDRAKSDSEIAALETQLKTLNEEKKANTDEGVMKNYQKNVLAIQDKINENAERQEETREAISTSEQNWIGMKDTYNQLNRENQAINFGGVNQKIEQAQEKYDKAVKKHNAAVSLKGKITEVARSRYRLDEAAKETDRLAVGENFTVDHLASLKADLDILDTKLNSYTKSGWTKEKNSDAFTNMAERLEDMKKGIREGKSQAALVNLAEDLMKAAKDYRTAKEAQWFHWFPSKQRINRLQAADSLARWSENFIESSKKLDPKGAELDPLTAEKTLSTGDIQRSSGDLVKDSLQELREKVNEPVREAPHAENTLQRENGPAVPEMK